MTERKGGHSPSLSQTQTEASPVTSIVGSKDNSISPQIQLNKSRDNLTKHRKAVINELLRFKPWIAPGALGERQKRQREKAAERSEVIVITRVVEGEEITKERKVTRLGKAMWGIVEASRMIQDAKSRLGLPISNPVQEEDARDKFVTLAIKKRLPLTYAEEYFKKNVRLTKKVQERRQKERVNIKNTGGLTKDTPKRKQHARSSKKG